MAIRRVHVLLHGYYDVDMDEALIDYGVSDPDQMLQLDQVNFNKLAHNLLASLDGDPKVVLRWELENPDASCYVLPNGQCVSLLDCVHTPKNMV